MILAPMQVFGETHNYIATVVQTDVNEVSSSRLIIDNEYYEVDEGAYIDITLENAEFDFDKNDRARIRSNGIDFDSGSKRRVSGQVTARGAQSDEISITFHAKALGGEAIVTIDGASSGITSGEYVFASTEDNVAAFKGKIQNNFPVYFHESLEVEPIIIKEPNSGVFRSIESNNLKDEPLLTLKIIGDSYEFRQTSHNDFIELEVHDGRDNSKRYNIGKGEELKLNNSATQLTFKKDYDTIFEGGLLYKLELKNLRIAPSQNHVKGSDIVVEFGGLLMEKQQVTLATESIKAMVLETSQADLKPGTTQTIKFKVQEGIPNTLFKEGYINVGIYGGALIPSDKSLNFKLREGNHTYTQDHTKMLKVEADPIGDRMTIKNYRRKDKNALLTLEGSLDVTIPEGVTGDIEFFVNEPSLTEALAETVLVGTDQSEEPESPDEGVEPIKEKVTFQIDNDTYTVGESSYQLDMKPYISPHDRIMVPFRYVAYALGVDSDDLKWEADTKTIRLEGDQPMTIDVNTGKMVIGANSWTLSEIRLLSGRTFVPVGEIGRAFGVDVDWDEETRTAIFN